MRIIVADDSTAMRMLVKRTLRQAGFDGHDIVEAADGAEALDLYRDDKPGLVLADWNMPNMTGIEFLESIRADGDETTFGLVTTEATAPMRKRAEQAGANFLITKPFSADSFRNALEGYL